MIEFLSVIIHALVSSGISYAATAEASFDLSFRLSGWYLTDILRYDFRNSSAEVNQNPQQLVVVLSSPLLSSAPPFSLLWVDKFRNQVYSIPPNLSKLIDLFGYLYSNSDSYCWARCIFKFLLKQLCAQVNSSCPQPLIEARKEFSEALNIDGFRRPKAYNRNIRACRDILMTSRSTHFPSLRCYRRSYQFAAMLCTALFLALPRYVMNVYYRYLFSMFLFV